MKNKTIQKIKKKIKNNKLKIIELKICHGFMPEINYNYYKLDDFNDIEKILSYDDDVFGYYIHQFEIILKNKYYYISKEHELFNNLIDYYYYS
jgi:hypothetical protein